MLEDVFATALRSRMWGVLRQAHALLHSRLERLPDSLVEILIRQKEVRPRARRRGAARNGPVLRCSLGGWSPPRCGLS